VDNVANEEPRRSWAGKDPSPLIPLNVTWFNVQRPLTLEELKGRVVLLDFWTLGCINCQHIIPDLKALEAEFGDNLVVIGVHSGKYATEHEDESVLEAVRRFGIEHPVINDPDFRVWNTFGASAWPTLVLIDPAGNLVGGHAGEGVYPLFQPIVRSLVDEFGEKGLLSTNPLPISIQAAVARAVLSYPGGVLADEAGERLFIADTGNNRIIEVTLDGRLVRAFGTGAEGFADGGPFEAAFRQPHGMALSADGGTLYVADTRNHAVRAINLESGETVTIAGTGRQLDRMPVGDQIARETALASPWDLVLADGRLFVSMAGVHQIWVYDPAAFTIGIFAGTSREGIQDGQRRTIATLAQPSGITTDGEWLYWVDPESSSLRRVPIAGDGDVETLVGTGLFEYGAADGPARSAQLQHAQAVAYDDGALYIADTYNHRLRVYDITAQALGTAAGSARGWSDGAAGMAMLDEPGGISVAGGRVYVADSNNHLIRVFEPANGQLSTLTLTNLTAIAPPAAGTLTRVQLGEQRAAPGASNLQVRISTPADFHLNSQAPSSLMLTSSNGAVLELGENEVRWSSDESEVTFPVPVRLTEGSAVLTGTLTAYYCRDGEEALCFIARHELTLNVTVAPGVGTSALELSYELPKTGG
jgi:sugar lactone lactonase YvrE